MSGQPPDGAVENIRGAIEIMFAKPSGLARMDLSSAGLVVSFAALVIAGLIDASAYSLRHAEIFARLVAADQSAEWSRLGYTLMNLLIALVSYAVSIFIVYLLATESEKTRVPDVVTVNNWAAPVVSLAVLPFIVLDYFLPSLRGVITMAMLGVLLCILVAGWQIMTISMNATPGRGGWLFTVSAVTSLIVNASLERFVGLASFAPPPA